MASTSGNGALARSGVYASALALLIRHTLPGAGLIWLLNRAVSSRKPAAQGRPGAALARSLGVCLPAAVLLLLKPIKLILRLLLGHGRAAADAPGRLPLIGHMLEIAKYIKHRLGIWDALLDIHTKLGCTFRIIGGPECCPLVVFHITMDPRNVEYILKSNFANYCKGSRFEVIFRELLGQGIFAVDGERWKIQRKIAAGIFSRRNFSTNMTQVFQAHARQLVSVLQKRMQQKPGGEVDLQQHFFALTMDSFSEIGFGIPWNSMDSLETDTTSGGGPIAGGTVQQKWAKHFDRAQSSSVGRFAVRQLWVLERLLWRWGLLPAAHEEAKLSESVAYMNHVIQDLLGKRLSEKKGGQDLLSLFMETTEDSTFLRDIMVNFIVAGRDTTACTLSWLFWELARFPDAYSKARREVLQEVASQSLHGSDANMDLSFDMLSRLKYCTACVRETVRLHPPVPLDPKVAIADDVLPDGTMISGGDMVCYTPYLMARDPVNWGADAAEWRPERWLEMEAEPSIFVNCAFQAGPRICLGRDMAILEAKAVLAEVLLSGLQWKVRPGYTPAYQYPSLVLPMKPPGLPVTVHMQHQP